MCLSTCAPSRVHSDPLNAVEVCLSPYPPTPLQFSLADYQAEQEAAALEQGSTFDRWLQWERSKRKPRPPSGFHGVAPARRGAAAAAAPADAVSRFEAKRDDATVRSLHYT